MIYLHGASKAGPEALEADGPWSNPRLRENAPFLLATAICPEADWPWQPAKVAALVERLVRDERVDPDRVYLTGVSMGGFGTWDAAATHPELFAAVAPVCGGGNPVDMVWMKSIPVWAFHGGKDDIVPPDLTRKAVQALEATGGTVKYTEYPDEAHLIQLRTYAEAELWTWLLAQRRGGKK